MSSNLEINKGNYKGEIKNNLKKSTNLFIWKMKFPNSLKVSSYNENDFNIIDCDNNVFDCSVKIDSLENTISIIPNHKYSQNTYYYLNILYSKSNPIYVAFRLVNDKFETIKFKNEVEYREFIQQDKTKSSKSKKSSKKAPKSIALSYIYEKIRYNWLPIILDILTILGLIIEYIDGEIVLIEFMSTLIVAQIVFGVAQLLVYLHQRRLHNSIILYNQGVDYFNNAYYEEALKCFNNAIMLNPKNIQAQNAIKLLNKK